MAKIVFDKFGFIEIYYPDDNPRETGERLTR